MALTDYNPICQYYFDGLTDLDEPTGTTKSNPGSTTDPPLAGSPDSYAEFDGTADGISFLPSPTILNVNTGDITLVWKSRIITNLANSMLWEAYDGTGTAGSNHGLRLVNFSSTAARPTLLVPPRATSFELRMPSTTLTLNQDYIMACRRSSGTWTLWVDADASGGMVAVTPAANNIGSSAITECADISFGCDRAGATLSNVRHYWFVAFDAAVSDTDIQLADWDTESNLKTAWLGGGPGPAGRKRPGIRAYGMLGNGTVRLAA